MLRFLVGRSESGALGVGFILGNMDKCGDGAANDV